MIYPIMQQLHFLKQHPLYCMVLLKKMIFLLWWKGKILRFVVEEITEHLKKINLA